MTSHLIDCPHCGNRGKVKQLPAVGTKIRCPKCGGTFVHGATAPPPAEPAERGAEAVFAAVVEPDAAKAGPESVFEPAEAARGEPLGEWVEAKALDKLAARIAGLERRNRLLTWACGLIGLVAVAGLATPFHDRYELPSKLDANLIVARRIHVTDDAGRVVASMAGIGPGNGFGTVTAQSEPEGSMSILSSSGLGVLDASGEPRLTVSSVGPQRRRTSHLARRRRRRPPREAANRPE